MKPLPTVGLAHCVIEGEPDCDNPMRILITSAASGLAQSLARSLSVKHHNVVLTDRKQLSTDQPFVHSELGHDDTTNELVRGVDAIVHSGEADPEASVSDQLDVAMRCTYNLLWAAAEERVSRFVYLSSLSLLEKYDEDMVVTEMWRPQPTTEPSVLCYHLGEFVCKEFGREGKIDVVCLRLGELVWDGEDKGRVSSSALYAHDLVHAVEQAVTTEVSSWDIFHVQSAVPNARYLTELAERKLGFEPRNRA